MRHRLQGGPGLGGKQPRLTRSWTLARAKVEAEGGCRHCGKWPVEAAHIIGRNHDSERPLAWEGDWPEGRRLIVAPIRVLALCKAHHDAYDDGDFDILALLDEDEQAQAVKDAGGLYPALWRLMASTNPRRVAA